jgi:c-di-GMP-binding flagellar brake protein YcgR
MADTKTKKYVVTVGMVKLGARSYAKLGQEIDLDDATAESLLDQNAVKLKAEVVAEAKAEEKATKDKK